MEFKQFTECIQAEDFRTRTRFITIVSLLAGTPAALIAVAASHPICLLIAAEIAALAGLVAYYHNWLYNRLICLGGDIHCIAMIVSIEEPVPLSSNFFDRDTDYSINLLLENTEFGEPDVPLPELQAQAEQVMPYGNFIAAQPSVTAIGRKTRGSFAKDKASGKQAAVLHAEFEGDGNYKMLLASKALLAIAIAALGVCLLLPWPAAVALAVFFFLISFLVLFLTSVSGSSGEGSPSGVTGGDLQTNTTDPESGQAVGASVVYVGGTWVYDTLHEGWNEIHPVKECCIVGCWKGDWSDYTCGEDDVPPPPPNIILRLRNAFQEARADETLANQARPEHQWRLHPDIDGCASDIIV